MKTKEYYITTWKTLRELSNHAYSSHGIPLDHPLDEIKDDTEMIFLVEAEDAGHLMFEKSADVTPLPTVYSPKPVADEHVSRLAKLGVNTGHTMMDLSDILHKIMPTMRHSRF